MLLFLCCIAGISVFSRLITTTCISLAVSLSVYYKNVFLTALPLLFFGREYESRSALDCVCVRELGQTRERRSIYRMNLCCWRKQRKEEKEKSLIHGICCIDKAACTFQGLSVHIQATSLEYIFAFYIFNIYFHFIIYIYIEFVNCLKSNEGCEV